MMKQSDSLGFNFVNIQHPDDLKDGETQLRIRRLAIREVGKTRRRPKNKRGDKDYIASQKERRERRMGLSSAARMGRFDSGAGGGAAPSRGGDELKG